MEDFQKLRVLKSLLSLIFFYVINTFVCANLEYIVTITDLVEFFDSGKGGIAII